MGDRGVRIIGSRPITIIVMGRSQADGIHRALHSLPKHIFQQFQRKNKKKLTKSTFFIEFCRFSAFFCIFNLTKSVYNHIINGVKG